MVNKKLVQQMWMKLYLLGQLTLEDLKLHVGELSQEVQYELDQRRIQNKDIKSKKNL